MQITEFFIKHDKDGIIIQEPFRNFEYNRNFVLEAANKTNTDYILLLDADMILEIRDFDKQSLTADEYYILQGTKNFQYKNKRLVKANLGHRYIGVTHEYLSAPVKQNTTEITIPTLFINDVGDGGSKTNKYERDIKLLLSSLEKEPSNSRTVFYLANSYKDSGGPVNAIHWYKKCLELNGWSQEKYCASLQLGNLLTNKYEKLCFWLKASDYDNERIEGVVNAMELLYNDGSHILVNALYHRFKNYATCKDKLFLDLDKYRLKIEYYNSISAYYANDKESGLVCCKRLLESSSIYRAITEQNIKHYYDNHKKTLRQSY